MSEPTDIHELLRRSFAQSAALIDAVQPAQMRMQTPCTDYDVRDLMGHMLFAAQRIGAAGRRDPLPEEPRAVTTGLADDQWSGAFAQSVSDAMAAWASPGVSEGDIVLPFGTFPAPVVASIYTLEQTTHAWDLAVAIGAADGLDPDLAEAVLPVAHQMLPPEGRVEEGIPFAPVIEVAAGASSYDRLAGFMGRRPDWIPQERADLLEALGSARHFLRYTLRDLDDAQARRRTTVSALCLGGLIKHVTAVERAWVSFITEGPSAMAMTPSSADEHLAGFRMEEGETLSGLLADYGAVAGRTDELVRTLPDLDASRPLPEAPWFEPGARRSARRVLVHIVAETAQHAGHADIIRESLDGARTMA